MTDSNHDAVRRENLERARVNADRSVTADPFAYRGRWTRRHWAHASVVTTMGVLLAAIVPGFSSVLEHPGDMQVQRMTLALSLPKLDKRTAKGTDDQWQSVTLKPGQTLSGVFEELGIPYDQLARVMQHPKIKPTLRKLRPGTELSFNLPNDGSVRAMRLEAGPGIGDMPIELEFTGDALRDADGEWLGASGAITGGDRAEEHAKRGQGVEAECECDAHDERREGEVFLVASGECREGGKRGHEDGDQKDAPILQLFDESTEPCHDGTGLGKDIEGAAHHEEEGDDADTALESFIDRSEEIEKSCRFLRYIVEGRWVDDHFSGLNVLDSVINARGDDVARNSAEYDDAHQYNDRAGCFECFHLIFH